MANSSDSHSLSPPSEAEEPHDDSLLVSMILTKKNQMPRTIKTQPERDDAADNPDGPISSPKPMEVPARRKPRGRPKGSKNKPKYLEPTIKTHVLEIQTGSDIVETIHYFARTQNAGVSVVSGVGRVRNVTVRNPVVHEPSIILSGAHEIVSINGIHVGPAKLKPGQDGSSAGGAQRSYLAVQLAGPRGAVWGGVVTGKLVAASDVILNVSTFADYEFHRLSSDDYDPIHQDTSTSSGGSSEGDPEQVGSGQSSGMVFSADDALNCDPTLGMMGRSKRARISEY